MSRKIEVKKVIIDHYSWPAGILNKSVENDAIMSEDIDAFKDWIRDVDTPVKSLKNGQKVMFDRDVVFPRRKFQKAYTTCKIVNNAADADVIIIDKEVLKRKYAGWYWCTEYKVCANGHYTNSMLAVNGQIKFTGTKKFVISTHVPVMIERINAIYEMDGKNLMDIRDLHLPSEQSLTLDSYEKLAKMLGGSDDTMRVVAMNMLTAYNYMTESRRIALLVNLYWSQWANSRYRKENVEIKAMLRKLSLDYPGLQMGVNSPRFWLQVAVESEGDEIVEKAFNLWVKTVYPDCPELKVHKLSDYSRIFAEYEKKEKKQQNKKRSINKEEKDSCKEEGSCQEDNKDSQN